MWGQKPIRKGILLVYLGKNRTESDLNVDEPFSMSSFIPQVILLMFTISFYYQSLMIYFSGCDGHACLTWRLG